MKTLIPGHKYELDNLKTGGVTTLQFYQDPAIHGYELEGPSCQEVLRCLIDRVKVLDSEKPWALNTLILQRLREAIILFETRALMLKSHRVDYIKTDEDGHFVYGKETN